VEHVDEKTVRIDGTFPIDDFNEKFGVELPIEDYHTVAGFVFGLLGRAAAAGDEVEHEGVRFRVLEVEGSRIEKLEVQFVEPPPVEEPEAGEERAAATGS
jgi:CBS domain containing-hemolysin-like protein